MLREALGASGRRLMGSFLAASLDSHVCVLWGLEHVHSAMCIDDVCSDGAYAHTYMVIVHTKIDV